MPPLKQRGSVVATILNAIYGAFLRRFFAGIAQVQVAEGADLSPRLACASELTLAHKAMMTL
jgi:hypothetical protein